LLGDDNLLKNLINADGFLEESEKNMLLEVIDKIGIFIPMDMQFIDVLTEELTAKVVSEIKEIETLGTLEGIPLLWNET